MPVIVKAEGSICDDSSDAIVSDVCCSGAPNGPLHKLFAKRFPINEEKYKKACADGKIKPGKIFSTTEGDMFGAWHILNFPTRVKPGEPSSEELILAGLDDLLKQVKLYKIKTLAVPALGCGAGKMKFDQVQPLIESKLGAIEGLTVFLYK